MLAVRIFALVGALSVGFSPSGTGLSVACCATAACQCKTMGAACPVCQARRAKTPVASPQPAGQAKSGCHCGVGQPAQGDGNRLLVDPLDPSVLGTLAPRSLGQRGPAFTVRLRPWHSRSLSVLERPPSRC